MITPHQLATFLEQVATKGSAAENWDHFAATHYDSVIMETARRACVQIVVATAHGESLSSDAVVLIRELAGRVRDHAI